MNLSLSSASLDLLPASPRPSCENPRNVSDDAKNNVSESDNRKASDFDDLLSRDRAKPKASSSSKSTHKKSSAETHRDSAPTPASASSDAAAASDLAAMQAYLAGPVTNETPSLSLPGLNAGAVGTTDESTATALADGGEFVPGGSDASLVAGATSAASVLTQAASTVLGSVPSEAAGLTASVREWATTSGPELGAQALVESVVGASGSQPGETPPAGAATALGRRTLAAGAAAAATAAREFGANIAGAAVDSPAIEKSLKKNSFSNFLNSHSEEVARTDEDLGTGIAKPSFTMAAVPFSHRQSATAESAVISSSTVIQADTAAPSFANQVTDTASMAHRAVDAVMSAAERVTSQRNSVNLQFSVGGNDLAVRVEFRGGAVHATFKTDSPELRAALSNEWSAAGSRMTDVSVRMAPPVFTSSNAGGSTSFSGQNAQQQQQSRDSSAQASAMFGLNPMGSAKTNSSSEDRSPIAAPRAVVSTSLHLHTFA